MKRQQLFLVIGGLVLFAGLFFFGKTVNPKKGETKPTAQAEAGHDHEGHIDIKDILSQAKQQLTADQVQRLTSLENSVVRGNVNEQQLHVYHQLARFWRDSAQFFEPYAYYTAEAAKLDNSEKSLTFAAQLYVDNLLGGADPQIMHWWAENAKVLLDKALEINPNNDSSKIGVGVCYMFGNISDNPMQGILPVREVAQKSPDNVYAQFVLGLGGRQSGQYDKAVERFALVVKQQPNNKFAVWQLAECYELKGDKPNAVKWYGVVKEMEKDTKIKKEIEKRINQLKG